MKVIHSMTCSTKSRKKEEVNIMTYEEFLLEVKEKIEQLKESYQELQIVRMPKYNGFSYDGLQLVSPNEDVVPVVNLNQVYESYCNSGSSIDDACDFILQVFKHNADLNGFSADYIRSYDNVKDQIIYRLINAEANRELLARIPHVLWLDLAIIFQVSINSNAEGTATMLINNSVAEMWKVTPEQLFTRAKKNTCILRPFKVSKMSEVLSSVCNEIADDFSSDMYILTNTYSINGAAAILYNGILHDIAETFESDLIIIPSSVHEVLLLPAKREYQVDVLSQMVIEVNTKEVPQEEILSDHVYYYSREDDKVNIPA